MTKTKQQLRAEAVERLKNSVGARFKPDAAVIAIVGGRIGLADWSLECDKLIDLLTDDCGPCYSCAKLAELRAENNALRGIVGDLKVPTDPGEASMMSVDAFIKKQTEHESRDTREKLEADMKERLGELWANAWNAGSRDSMDDDFDIDAFNFLLDRQSAITEREIFDEMPHVRNRLAELREDVAERDDVIAVLKAGNADLQAKVDELTAQLEAAHAKNRALKAHIAKMQAGRHGWHVKGVELQREVDKLARENISLARDLGECMAERDGLRRENAKLSDDEFYLRCTLVDMNGEVVG